MVKSACVRPGSLSLCISTGLTAALEMMKKVERFADAVKLLTGGTTSYSSTQTCVTFSNGSRVMCLPSGNPAGLRGWSAQCVDGDSSIEI